MNDKTLFEVLGLKFARRTCALKRPLNFSLAGGQWCTLRGANGSGKTTLLRILCGLSEAPHGAVHWRGVAIQQQRAAYHQAVTYIGHKQGFRGGLSVTENLQFYRELRNGQLRNARASIATAMDYFGLRRVAQQPFAALSHGQQQRGALCRLLIEQSALWLLDEPTSALDQQGDQLFIALLKKHLASGGSAVIATHKPLGDNVFLATHQLELKDYA